MKESVKSNVVSLQFEMSMQESMHVIPLLFAVIVAHGSIDAALASGHLVLGSHREAVLRRMLPVWWGGQTERESGRECEANVLRSISETFGRGFIGSLQERLGIKAPRSAGESNGRC